MADTDKDDVEYSQKDGAGDQPNKEEKPGRLKRMWQNMVKALRDDDDEAREEVNEDVGEALPDAITGLQARRKHNAELEDAYHQSDR